MNNSGLSRSQSDTFRSDTTSSLDLLAPTISSDFQIHSPTCGSTSMKRKACDSLASSSLKKRRNLSWNGFEHIEVHELSSDDEIDPRLPKTRGLTNKAFRKGSFSYRAFPGSLSSQIRYNRLDNQRTPSAKSEFTPNLQYITPQVSHEGHNGRSWQQGETEQQAQNNGGRPVSSSKQTPLSNPTPSPGSNGTQITLLGQRMSSGNKHTRPSTMQPKDLRDPSQNLSSSNGEINGVARRGVNPKLVPNTWSRVPMEASLTSSEKIPAIINNDGRQKSQQYRGKIDKNQVPLTHRAVPQNLILSSRQESRNQTDMIGSEIHIENIGSQSPEDIFTRALQNTKATFSGQAYQDEHPHNISATTLKDNSFPIPALPSCMQLSSTANIFAKQKEKQRLKNGIGNEMEISEQGHNKICSMKRYSCIRDCERAEAPGSMSADRIMTSSSCDIDQRKRSTRSCFRSDHIPLEPEPIRSGLNVLGQTTAAITPYQSQPIFAKTLAFDLNPGRTLGKIGNLDKALAPFQVDGQNVDVSLSGNVASRMNDTLLMPKKNGDVSSKHLNYADGNKKGHKMAPDFEQALNSGSCSSGNIIHKTIAFHESEIQTEVEDQEDVCDTEAMKSTGVVLGKLKLKKGAVKTNKILTSFAPRIDQLGRHGSATLAQPRREDSTGLLANSSNLSKYSRHLRSRHSTHRERDHISRSQPSKDIERIEISEAGRLIDESLSRLNAKYSSHGIMNQRTDQSKRKKNYDECAIDIEKVTEDDWFLIQLRRAGWELKDIHARWKEWTGSTKTRQTLRRRLSRLRKTFPDVIPGDNADDTGEQNLSILQQIRDGAENKVAFVTGNNGLNHNRSLQSGEKRAEERNFALTEGPPEKMTPPRNKYGGKTLSQDLQNYIIDSLQRSSEDFSEAHEEEEEDILTRRTSPEAEDDYIHFAYQVRRRTILPGQSDAECPWHVCGDPFSSITEANEAAIAEAKITRRIEVWPLTKWNVEISEETGLICLRGAGVNGAVEVDVQRFLRNYFEAVTPKTKDGWVARRVFDVYEIRTTSEKTVDWADDFIEEPEKDLQVLDNTLPGNKAKSQKASYTNGEVANATTLTPNNGGEITYPETQRSKAAAEVVGADEHLFNETTEISPPCSGQFGGIEYQSASSKMTMRAITRPKIITNTIHVIERPVGSIFAVRDRANRLAGKMFRQKQRELELDPSRQRLTMDNYFAEQQADEEMNERLDKMEKDDENFDDIVQIQGSQQDEEQTTRQGQAYDAGIRLRVVERTLENPRNF